VREGRHQLGHVQEEGACAERNPLDPDSPTPTHQVRDGSTEPQSQLGLEFDTEVSNKIDEDVHIVTKTNPKAWAADAKHILRAFKDKRGDPIKIPVRVSEMFEKFKERGVKVCAYTNANLIATYPHECLGNILESAGVKVA